MKQGKYLLYVFTEQGVAMLTTVLKNSVADKISVQIMDVFVLMRKYILKKLIERKFINELVLTHDKDIKLLKESFDKLSDKELKNEYNNLKIIYNDTFYDIYFILDKKTVYHCGASINHMGSKTFSINKLEEDIVIKFLIAKIENS